MTARMGVDIYRFQVIHALYLSQGVVKAMDTMDLFVRDGLGLEAGVNKFMLAGESKRGWTTWMTGPIDDRVVAMAPVVLSNLNMVPVFDRFNYLFLSSILIVIECFNIIL